MDIKRNRNPHRATIEKVQRGYEYKYPTVQNEIYDEADMQGVLDNTRKDFYPWK